MPNRIDRHEVQRLLAKQRAQLVEVLPEAEFEDEHLPGAINVPLKTLDARRTQQLGRERPVIVYCYDYQWDLSPRAASRLESLGFEHVNDYAAGKADWGSYGLPLEGLNGSETRAGAHLQTDVPTCRLDARLQDVCERLEGSDWDTCFVVDDRGVVLGRLGRQVIRERPNVAAEEAMTLGPSTVRPSARLHAMVERMQREKLTNLPVTTSDGKLLGLLMLPDAEEALRQLLG
jgi:rhodanese-related sulfurtransferase